MRLAYWIFLYVLLLNLQGYLTYKILWLECKFAFQYESQGHTYLEYFNCYLPQRELLFQSVLFVLFLPLFYYFNVLFEKKKFWCLSICSSINYLFMNMIITSADLIILSIFQQIYRKQIYYTNWQKTDDCKQPKYILISWLIISMAWYITLTYIYLLQNGKYNQIIQLFGKLGFLFRIILLVVTSMSLIFCAARIQAMVQSILSVDYHYYQELPYYQSFFFLSTTISLIYILYLQLQEVLTTIGSKNIKHKLLNFFICQNMIKSQVQSFFYFNYYLNQYKLFDCLILHYIIIQLNSYQKHFFKQQQGTLNFSINNVYCYQCQECITMNDQVVYFNDSQNAVHKNCFFIQQDQFDQFVRIIYIKDLKQWNKPLIRQNPYNTIILHIIGWAYLYFMMTKTNFQFQNLQTYTIYIQLLIIFQLLLSHLLRLYRIYFFLELIGFITYLIITNSILNHAQEQFISCFNSDMQYECIREWFINFAILINYNNLINFIQAYQLTSLIIFQRQPKRVNQIIFYFFILINIQFFSFIILNFQSSIASYVLLLNIIMSLSLMLCYYFIKIKKITQYWQIISKRFLKKLIFICISLIIQTIVYFFLQRDEIYILQFLQPICIQIIYYLVKLLKNEAKELLRNQQILFSDRRLLLTPINRSEEEKCNRCQKQFKNGQNIIYFQDCQHFLHKSCRIKWINYEWCCQMASNQYIEIILN